jgi:hypothetical protein
MIQDSRQRIVWSSSTYHTSIMVASEVSLWDGIISSATCLLNSLAPHLPEGDKETLSISREVTRLHLPDVDSHSLQQALSRRNMSATSKREITAYFSRCGQELRGHYESHWLHLHRIQLHTIGERHFTLLRQATQKKYLDHSKNLVIEILKVLDRHVDRFTCDVDAAAKSDSESSEDGNHNPRGHSKLALTILEKAYSHTTNITRAEKVRLAAITGLQPRQVTIWVSGHDRIALPEEREVGTTRHCALTDV